MNRILMASNPVWDRSTRVITLNAGAAALSNQPLVSGSVNSISQVWVAQGGAAADLTRPIAGVLVSANTAAVTIQTSATAGVGIEIPANQSLYIPVSGEPDIRYDSTAAFAVAVFFQD